MASPTFYAAGTVSVANAATAVTGVGTAWVGKVYPGDLFADPAQPMVPPQRVASVTDDTHLVLCRLAGHSDRGRRLRGPHHAGQRAGAGKYSAAARGAGERCQRRLRSACRDDG